MKDMDLQLGLDTFSKFADQESEYCRISLVGPSILHLQTKSKINSGVTIGYMAMVHGNEMLGLPILNTFIQSLLDGEITSPSDLYFALGNIPAAFADKRFIEEDMNRCFGKSDVSTAEARRAREIESLMLCHCDFLLDIHQTVFSSKDPFFIFQYTNERCLAVMEKWNPGIPVILQKDQLGDNTGLCADEYMRSLGKFGTALELGQLGTSGHYLLGLGICQRVLEVTTTDLMQPKAFPQATPFSIMILQGAFKAENSSSKLDDGWHNLSFFKKGQRLGFSEHGVVEAPVDGYMLFPRYRPVGEGEALYYYCTQM